MVNRTVSDKRRATHYYTPAPRIAMVPGVTRKENGRSDIYTGEAAALQEAGLLPAGADMLPPPGTASITWRPTNRTSNGVSEPGYMQIRRRPSGGFVVDLIVSDEEHSRRKEKAEREKRERQERYAAQEPPPTGEEQQLLEVYRRMPASFKPVAVIAVEQLRKAQSDPEKTCWLNVWRACCAAANHEVQAAPARGHLRLAWSAPEAPAWTADL